MPNHPDLLAEIEAFVKEAGITEITFGRKAMADPHFVRDLRKGRRMWPETETRVRDWMANNQPAPAQDAAA